MEAFKPLKNKVTVMFMPRKLVEEQLIQLLKDDVGQGDATATAIIPQNLTITAEVIAKESGIAAGIKEATILAQAVNLKVKAYVTDGEQIKNKQVLIQITGDTQAILTVERTLLNLLSRMCGIATTTWEFTEKLKTVNPSAVIAATRKTAPGLLYFDKKAVTIGGGDPHRLHLDDMILIKDNHIAVIGDPAKAVKLAKKNTSFSKKIEVEITKATDILQVAEAGADIIMLDNFTPDEANKAAEILKNAKLPHKVLLEVSGGINNETLLDYAQAKVDIISIGALTHSVKALDISLEIIKK
ncbi:MAG: carboxylating nicotinate-nucleotide diphosphorylase [Nitrososphaerota archaeon]|jgi:nicotinate-nucleotide pyrophosphorylase (carboxylating)|nr:carboxylating nicotinate-nucleotide diphosphorylase [Nitrososphaerota archaeon]